MHNPALSQRLADFVVSLNFQSMPAEVVEKARTCLLNGYGMARGSYNTPYVKVARAAALATNGELTQHGAALLGDGRKTTIAGAALANSALFHGRAQEDTLGAAHIGAIVIPLLTAMIEAQRLPLDRLIPALVAAYEAAGLFEHAYSPITTPASFRASPLYGVVAAAAGAARLMGLSADKTAAALSNAASFTGGILQSFDDGTDEWRYQVGVAAAQGLTAAALAQSGSVSARHAFEGRNGFVRAFARTSCDVGALSARLGEDWSIRRVTFKPYPVCAFNQTPVIASLALREQIGARKIRSVTVRMNPFEAGYAGMDSKGPFDSISGTLMSIPFCIATTLVNGTPSMAHMTNYTDPLVNSTVDRIELVADASVPRLHSAIEVTMEDGSQLSRVQEMGTADYSFSREQVGELVRRVGAESGVDASVYQRLEEFVSDPDGRGIDALLRCFVPAAFKEDVRA